jgi:ribosomal protein S18 acetylase RimI-like enzyme
LIIGASADTFDRAGSRPSPDPRPVVPAEIPDVARVIARAFAWHEPWGEFCFPDESVREDALARLAEHDLTHSFVPAGCAWTIAGRSVALWIPPASHPLAKHFADDRRDPAQYEVYGAREPLIRANDELVGSLRPAEPHWYLDTLATDPEHFGEGLASRLVDHGLAERAGEDVALDVHLDSNRRFYERWGFEIAASGHLPGEELEVTIMLRKPRGR